MGLDGDDVVFCRVWIGESAEGVLHLELGKEFLGENYWRLLVLVVVLIVLGLSMAVE